MPSIMATPYPTRGMVLVEVMFADVPAATNICVTATNTVTGEVRQLHPYIFYNGDGCLALSCGQAIFWDTEIPCGVAVQYCATAVDANGDIVTTSAANLVTDTFTRTVANGWGTADSGQVWSTLGGVAANYSVTGTQGQHAAASTGIDYITKIAMTTPNAEAMVTAIPLVLSAGNSQEMQMWLRSDGTTSNGYNAIAVLTTGGQVSIFLQKVVGAVATTLATVASAFPYTATTQVNIKLKAWGSQLMAKFWDSTTPEPSAYQLTATDSTFTSAGSLLLVTHRDGGNTNGTTTKWDDLSVVDVCAEPAPIVACTENVTIACDGCFRLGDPVRPCNDIQVCFCYDTANGCGGTSGVFFAGMTPDVYGANSGLMAPVNSVYPIPITRNRRAAAGTFTLVPTSFTARDSLLALLAPGGPLLWRGPAEYGTKDRYIQVGDVPVAPVLADLRVQPRVVDLPFSVAKAPVGPTQGVCGARFEDLCDVYSSWDAIVAAGLTYADLLRGEAGTTPANLPDWNLVNSTYASWNALNAGQTSWTDTLGGVP